MPKRTFELGLVMAGAVSAGAYTAGVIDFLLQALKEWEAAKRNNVANAPPHAVQLSVVSGSSAGGMAGAILAAMINEPFETITCLPGRKPQRDEIANNKLYRAWVEQIDITPLLGNNDLQEKNSKVVSLLDSTILNKIARSAIQFDSSAQRPPFIADHLQLYLTLTNLDGVPYHTTFKGKSGKGHTIRNHADYFHFQLSNHNSNSNEAKWLDPNDDQQYNWDLLKQVALATGAFPGGLAPRIINRPLSDYGYRLWSVPQQAGEHDKSGTTDCFNMEHIEPNWPPHDQDRYNFLNIDGGVMDNEPTELARRALAGKDGYNPRSADKACRSIIMIDPFPSENESHLKSRGSIDKDIAHVMMSLFGSLKSQARFNPDELILANSDDVYSRFLIAPTRRNDDNTMAEHPIASGFLHGFGGFLSKMFRMHDFQLGRRNCQQFLRSYFALPVKQAKQNPVFEDYRQDDFDHFSFIKENEAYIPVIPLLGEAKKEEFPLKWEVLAMTARELDSLETEIKGRTKTIVNRLIEQYINNWFSRMIAKTVACIKRDNMVEKMMQVIKEDLDEFDLR